jgi:hypothetical protein
MDYLLEISVAGMNCKLGELFVVSGLVQQASWVGSATTVEGEF